MSRLSKIRQDAPEVLENPELVDLIVQADQLQDIKALADMDGGKQLIKLLMQDVVAKVNQLEGSYKTATHIELIATIADMSAQLTIARLLIKSKENIDILDKEISEALSE